MSFDNTSTSSLLVALYEPLFVAEFPSPLAILNSSVSLQRVTYFPVLGLKELKETTINLTKKDKKEIEKDVYDLIDVSQDITKPIVLDLESIRIVKPGKYELDLVQLFKKQPLIYKLDEGKYVKDCQPMSNSILSTAFASPHC